MTSPDLEPPSSRYGWRPLVVILVVILVAAGVGITLQLRKSDTGTATDSSCSGTGVRGEVELTADASAAPADLTRAATILKQRLSRYDCDDPGVTVAGDRLLVSASAAAIDHLDQLIAPGRLEFREVLAARPSRSCATSEQALRRIRSNDRFTACSQDGTEQLDLLPAAVLGSDIASASPQQSTQVREWQILIRFTEAGQRRFTDLTGRLIGKRLAIVLDGVVVSAPSILEKIEGPAQITGSFTEESATTLAAEVAFGALPVALHRA